MSKKQREALEAYYVRERAARAQSRAECKAWRGEHMMDDARWNHRRSVRKG